MSGVGCLFTKNTNQVRASDKNIIIGVRNTKHFLNQ